MRRAAAVCLGMAMAAWTMGCGSGEGAPSDPPVEDDGITDVRVSIPEPEEGVIDIVSGEAIVEPGSEKMICFHYTYEGETTAVAGVDMLQGKFGHHAVMVTTQDPQPHGTVEDCTDQSEMWKYSALFVPVDDMPAGYGIELPQGFQMVLQAHYVNTSDKPIKIQDVVRLRTIDHGSVERWVSTFTTSDLGFAIPPLSPQQSAFDCTLDEDVDLLFIAGHMHEYGKSFELLLGPDEQSMESLYVVPEWDPDFRDAPPVELMFDDPMPMPAGTIARTKCAWDNTLSHELAFPEEMCTAFGYIAGTKNVFDCRVGE